MIANKIDVDNSFAANDNFFSTTTSIYGDRALHFLQKLRPHGPWVLTAIVPDGATITETLYTADEVTRFVRQCDGTQNIYYSVNPTRTDVWKKTTKADIAQIEFVLADLDPRPDESPGEAKNRYADALEEIQPEPTAVVDSGNGVQVLWRLEQPIPLGEPVDGKYSPEDQVRIEDVEARIGALIVRLGGTVGTQNIDRILRLPGTINLPNETKRKAGRVPCETRLIGFDDNTCSLAAFPMPPSSFNGQTSKRQHQPNDDTSRDVASLLKGLDEATKKLIKTPASPDEDRSAVAMSVMLKLMRRGVSDAIIEAVFDTYSIGERYNRKTLIADIERVRRKFNGSDNQRQNTTVDARTILMINDHDPTDTAKRLAALIAEHGQLLFNANDPIRICAEAGNLPKALVLNAESVRVLAHEISRPMRRTKKGELVDVPLSTDVANIYLRGLEGHWGLRPFKGITTSPILEAAGTIRTADGYDPATGLWCYRIPNITVPEKPSRKDAEKALRTLRNFFRTFAFADATMTYDADLHVGVVADSNPQMDESTFLNGLMTGVCRQSLETAPGFLTSAPTFSGAGTGKGLLVKAVTIIATGIRPQAFTSGHDELELDKRLSSALIEARPCIFLDNFNAKDLKSDILASALTESTMMVRVFGKTKNVPLFTRAFIAITGNGIQIAEDMARRLLLCNLDAKMENPEQRQFKGGFLDRVYEQRAELLTAVLTIWRYGQQNEIRRGLPLGNYELWARWVRDPLLDLGCQDPVLRIVQIKADDPRRKAIAEVFEAWWRQHGDQPVKANGLHDEVKQLLEPNATMVDGILKYNRQRVARWLVQHKGTRVGGYWIEEVVDIHNIRNRGTTYRLHTPYEELTQPTSIHAPKQQFMGFK